jgi:pimeloyl-ACP methyl ester carboxylesterase
MFYNAKNHNIKIEQSDMDYISFGKGNKNLIIIPGLGDGLRTVKGMAIPLAFMYKQFAKEYTVYVFSRRNNLTRGFTTQDMALDITQAMNILNISNADIMGVSQGGMIAQCIAINNPERVNKLVLVVTTSKTNEMINSVIGNWIQLAEKEDFKSLFIDTAEKSYSESYLAKYKKYYNILWRFCKPKDYKRFIIQANSCLTHNVYDDLDKIKCPTLIIGGKQDSIVGVNSSKEIADRISNSELYLYEEYGHAVYEEAKDFNEKVLRYLKR